MTKPSPEAGSSAKLSRAEQKRARRIRWGGVDIVNIAQAKRLLKGEQSFSSVEENSRLNQSFIEELKRIGYIRERTLTLGSKSNDTSKHLDEYNFTNKQSSLDSLKAISRDEFERRPPLEQMPMWPDILQHYPSAQWAFNNVDPTRIDQDSKDQKHFSTCIGVVLRYDNGLSEPDEAVGTVEFPLMAEVTVGEDGKATIEYGAVAPPLAVRADLAASRQTPKGEGPSN